MDGAAKVITFVIDGVLCDGGTFRTHGWQRFTPSLNDINGREAGTIGLAGGSRLQCLRLYTRYLRTSEAVGNFRHGCGES